MPNSILPVQFSPFEHINTIIRNVVIRVGEELNDKDLIAFAVTSPSILKTLEDAINERLAQSVGFWKGHFSLNGIAALKIDEGKVWARGDNASSTLLGVKQSNKLMSSWVKVESLSNKNMMAVSTGLKHSLALSSDKKVFACGSNKWGRLGTGDSISFKTSSFIEVTTLTSDKIKTIIAGDYHSLVLSDKGIVYSWGSNKHGSLGIGQDKLPTPYTLAPVKVEFPPETKIIKIEARGNHCLALDAKHRVYAWGANEDGQLGIGNNENQYVPIELNELKNIKIINIAAGGNFSFAVSDIGIAYGWGCNVRGQLGIPGDISNKLLPTIVTSLPSNTLDIYCQEPFNTYALDAQGTVYINNNFNAVWQNSTEALAKITGFKVREAPCSSISPEQKRLPTLTQFFMLKKHEVSHDAKVSLPQAEKSLRMG